MNTPLTSVETEIVSLLKDKINTTGVFGEMMKMVFYADEPTMTRQLLAEIKSQAYTAPEATAKVVGYKTFLLVSNL
ncbi:MAG: hypothetical protein QM802_03700 [Agriterribacter sp.]